MAKLSNDELISAIEQEEATAINWADGPLAEQRAEALRRYRREPYGNEVDGRSQVVSNDVQDTITSIMPSLARVFLSGDEIGKFEPLDPSDQGYEIESEVVNWYLMTKNDGYSTIYSALKDSLLLGNAYVKCWWRENKSVKAERYCGPVRRRTGDHPARQGCARGRARSAHGGRRRRGPAHVRSDGQSGPSAHAARCEAGAGAGR